MMSTLGSTARATSELSSYAYSYPHKSSYRRLSPPVRIVDAWRDEDVSSLSLYVHLPFCEMRCGFCNLFTQSQPSGGVVEAYLATLRRQMNVVHRAVPGAHYSQLAIGGGTPTYLSAAQLTMLFSQLEATFGCLIAELATSIEVSPVTATEDRLDVLADFGVERVSIGVQSFDESEAHVIGRPQRSRQVHQALESIRARPLSVLNIDLIYGDPQQTRASWLASLRAALRYRPEELYLYPLYVRPETGLGRVAPQEFHHRADLYVAARDLLVEGGYEQSSLRCFRRPRRGLLTSYGCQRDGMIGFGCGARSYTRQLHYSTRFAVSQAGIRAILGEWIAQSDAELAMATHGMWLSHEEQLRRYLILSLLQVEGLAISELLERFPDVLVEDIPEIAELIERGWLTRTEDRLVMTSQGLQESDRVGPLLYSPAVRDRLRDFVGLSGLAESRAL